MAYRPRNPLFVTVIDTKGIMFVCLPGNAGWVPINQFLNDDVSDWVVVQNPTYVNMNLHMLTEQEMRSYL